MLTPRQPEMHGCIVNIVAADGLVLKHQAISIHSADKISIVQYWTSCVPTYKIYSEQH